MSGEYGYVVRLLRKLEFLLTQSGNQREAGRIGQITQRIARADDVRAALKTLYGVEGYRILALRLLYCADVMGPFEAEIPDDHLIEYHVERLYDALVGSGKEGAPSAPERRPPSSSLSQEVERFVENLHGIKRSMEPEGTAIGRTELEVLLASALTLGATADREGARDIAHFAASVSTFLRYVLDRSILRDVRVANILDNAALTLQTVLPAVGADDYDSLAQMNRLLSDPATLLN